MGAVARGVAAGPRLGLLLGLLLAELLVHLLLPGLRGEVRAALPLALGQGVHGARRLHGALGLGGLLAVLGLVREEAGQQRLLAGGRLEAWLLKTRAEGEGVQPLG